MRFASLFLLLAACGSPERVDDDPLPPPSAIDEQFHVAPGGVGALAVDADTLYFVDGSVLHAMPQAGGGVTTLYTAPAPPPSSIGGIDSIHVGATELAIVESTLEFETGIVRKTLRLVPKAGGASTVLAESADVRAFLGVTFDGNFVVYSSFTSVLRVPRAGGAPQYIGESEGDTDYWIFSPVVHGDALYWGAGHGLYRLPRGGGDEGERFAPLTEASSKIVAIDDKLVVALATDIDFQSAIRAYREVDPVTGETSARVELGEEVTEVAATRDFVWTATLDGLARVPRAGGEREQLTAEGGFHVAASATAVFASTNTGITRVGL